MRPELTQAIDLLRSSTPEGVEEAIGLLQKTVYSFSMKVCGHREDAEDTMQEVLYRSLGHLGHIQEPRALAVWLYTVTRNRCWRMRKSDANGFAHMLSLDELMPDDAELARLLKDPGTGPEGKLLEDERSETLQQAVLRIPAQLRMVLVLHDMEQLTTEEVAQVLNLQPGTVRVRLHRARLSVRRQMSRSGEAGAADSRRVRRGRKAGTAKQRPAECRELFRNLSDYVDGLVEAPACEQMSRHIDACPSCIVFLRQLRAAIDRCRAMEVPCDEAVMARLRTLLAHEYLRLMGNPAPKKNLQKM